MFCAAVPGRDIWACCSQLNTRRPPTRGRKSKVFQGVENIRAKGWKEPGPRGPSLNCCTKSWTVCPQTYYLRGLCVCLDCLKYSKVGILLTALICIQIHSLLLLLSFLGPHPRHMEVPRLGGVKLELQLLSRVLDLHHNSRQYSILNPLREARDQTRNLVVPSWIR